MFTLNISEDTIEKFASFVNETAQSNSLIVSGPSGIGKKYIIEAFLKKQLSINDLVHHNLLWLDAEHENIPIGQVRKIQDFVYKTSYDQQSKFVVINAFDKLNMHAYNSLLKILEEPTKGTIFILISSHYKLLPATIKSRCVTVKFHPASKSEAARIVKSHFLDIADDDLEKYCYLANYAPFRVLKLIGSDYLAFYRSLLKLLLDFFKDPEESFTQFDKMLKDTDQLLICHAFSHIITKTILYVACKGECDFPVEEEEGLIKQILYLHPTMAQLLLLEEKIKKLLVSLDKANLNKQNIFLIVIYKLMYK